MYVIRLKSYSYCKYCPYMSFLYLCIWFNENKDIHVYTLKRKHLKATTNTDWLGSWSRYSSSNWSDVHTFGQLCQLASTEKNQISMLAKNTAFIASSQLTTIIH